VRITVSRVESHFGLNDSGDELVTAGYRAGAERTAHVSTLTRRVLLCLLQDGGGSGVM